MTKDHTNQPTEKPEDNALSNKCNAERDMPKEFGGRKEGLEPTRYGDWEKAGKCVDF